MQGQIGGEKCQKCEFHVRHSHELPSPGCVLQRSLGAVSWATTQRPVTCTGTLRTLPCTVTIDVHRDAATH